MDRITSSRPGWKRPDLALIVILAGVSLAGIVLILYATNVAPWAFSDSAAYLTTAKNIAAGRGVVLQDYNGNYGLLPLHAPLYPIVLSLPVAFGAEAVQATRWLYAFLFGGTIFLAGWFTNHFCRSFWLSISASLLILFGLESVTAFSGAMSEGLFIFLCLISLGLTSLALEKSGQKVHLLLAAGAAAGMAILARYTGLALLAAGGAAVFFLTKGRFSQRVKSLLLLILPGLLVSAFWLVPVYGTSRTFGNRSLEALANISGKVDLYFKSFLEIFGSWLPFYYRGNHIITPAQKLVLALVLLAGLLFLAWRKRQPLAIEKSSVHSLKEWFVVLALFLGAYIILHLAAFTTAEIQPDINGRLLLPVNIFGILLAATLAAYISRIFPKKWICGLIFFLLTILTVWYFHSDLKLYLFEMHNYGNGYTSKRWEGNQLFNEIVGLDTTLPLYSNNSALVLFYTERFPQDLPLTTDQGKYAVDDRQNFALILFNDVGQKDLPNAYDQFVNSLRNGYSTVFENDEGIIFIPLDED